MTRGQTKHPCEACGRNKWKGAPEIIVLPFLAAQRVESGAGLRVIPMICVSCSYVRLFSVEQLDDLATGLRRRKADGNGHIDP
jgi:hypothetical protein